VAVELIARAMLPGCGRNCSPRWHDPEAHESYGRRQAEDARRVVTAGPMAVDLGRMVVTLHGQDLGIGGSKQLGLLVMLARAGGAVVTFAELATALYASRLDARTRIAIYRLVWCLRERLGDAGARIKRVHGVGIRLETDA
jgi:DNA-binding response OmpR family regulator